MAVKASIPRRRRTEGVLAVLGRALRQHGMLDFERRMRIYQIWPQAVGEVIAKRAQPSGFRKGLLWVKVPSPTWLHELRYVKPQMLKNLRQALQENIVQDIRFVAGCIDQPSETLGNSEPNPIDPEAFAWGMEVGASIEDPQLQAIFARAAARAKQSHSQPPLQEHT